MDDDIVILPAPAPTLSRRQQEVLNLVAQGLDCPQIAVKLLVAPTTVKSHIQRMRPDFETADRAHMVAIAYRCGLLGTGPLLPEHPDVLYAYRRRPDADDTVPADHLKLRHIGAHRWIITRAGYTLNLTGTWDRTPTKSQAGFDWDRHHIFTCIEYAELMARATIRREADHERTPWEDPTP